jgi:hypothetical protein
MNTSKLLILLSLLQGKTHSLQICQEDYLPEASRFAQLEELDWALGLWDTDKANICYFVSRRHL